MEKLTQAAGYEHNGQRQGYRSGHCNRNLTTTSGDVTLKAQWGNKKRMNIKLLKAAFEDAPIVG